MPEATAVLTSDKDLTFEDLLAKHRAVQQQQRPERETSEESGQGEARLEPRPEQRDLRKAARGGAQAHKKLFALSNQTETMAGKARAGEDCLLIHRFHGRQQESNTAALCNGFSSLQLQQTTSRRRISTKYSLFNLESF